ncbi:MAG: VOC family protein [Gammaproteobacteria bacterium]|nr:VOC family protein [Gammaproteobacteria bacterium]MBI5616316.1 VOC family protein [Gammaproteobacteria bacterium]
MKATPKLAHFVFKTNRLAEMRDWYCTVLDAHVVYENSGLCFITFDEEHHRIALLAPPPGQSFVEPPPDSTGLMHTAFTFADLGDLLERYVMLDGRGIKPRVPLQHGVTTSMYYRDPDGYFVELQVDNFASAAEADAYMRGPEFAADPIGVVFDPAAMVEARAAGVDDDTLKTRAWALQGPPQPHAMTLFAQG